MNGTLLLMKRLHLLPAYTLCSSRTFFHLDTSIIITPVMLLHNTLAFSTNFLHFFRLVLTGRTATYKHQEFLYGITVTRYCIYFLSVMFPNHAVLKMYEVLAGFWVVFSLAHFTILTQATELNGCQIVHLLTNTFTLRADSGARKKHTLKK